MKVKVNWRKLGKQLWEMCRALARVGRAATAKPPARAHAVKPVLLAAIGGGIVSAAAGCSSLTPSSKVQSMGVYAFGLPAVAIITQSEQIADYSGGDTNGVSQANPVTTIVPIKAH